jgi:hypothetical protein
MALTLLKDRFTEAYNAQGFYTRYDFLEFGKLLEIKESRIIKITDEFSGKENNIDLLVDVSLLRADLKTVYKDNYKDKMKRLQMVWASGKK